MEMSVFEEEEFFSLATVQFPPEECVVGLPLKIKGCLNDIEEVIYDDASEDFFLFPHRS